MHCSVYAGPRAPDAYLFLPVRDNFQSIPQTVLERFGPLRHVTDLVLTPSLRLARIQAPALMRALLVNGCHVQLPPRQDEGFGSSGRAGDPRSRINGTAFGGRHDG